MQVLGTCSERSVGGSPTWGTTFMKQLLLLLVLNLAWNASPSAIMGYHLYDNGVCIYTTPFTTARVYPKKGNHLYYVKAFDYMGAESLPTNSVTYK